MTTKNKSRVYLAHRKARPIWAGHPWVYSGAISHVEGDPQTGSVVQVCDHKGDIIGVGTFNASARIAVRMLGSEIPQGGVEALVRERILAARDKRQRLGLPSEDTNAYRLINGEGDGLPGVFCDLLGDLASVEITTATAEQWIPIILKTLKSPAVCVSVPEDSARMEGIAPGDRLGKGDLEEPVSLTENGISWTIKAGKGQKTGFYTDQRENRTLIGQISAGKSVLDTFCYTGGFSLNAAKGGAKQVVGVDSSGPAVDLAQRTAKANGLEATYHHEDVMRYLKALGQDDCFDVVIMDPPKFARSRLRLDDAYKKYRAINAEGLKHVTAGGFFLSCSCSSLVNDEMFMRLLTDSAHVAGRRLNVHKMLGAGMDYPTPVAHSEGRYLTVALCSVI
jgi:23S rRNA (cytosine1962-C5)-methyltransferase